MHIQQTIHICMIKIGGMTNSSVLQIGTSGVITAASSLYNTGGYTEEAPAAQPETVAGIAQSQISMIPL